MHAMPDRYAGPVVDDAGCRVPIDGAEFRRVGRAGFWFLRPPDASGVQAGGVDDVWYQWTDAWEVLTRSRRRPGGRYPRSTVLLALSRADPQIALTFTLGSPARRGVQSWIAMPRGWDGGVPSPFGPDGQLGPAFRRAPGVIAGVDHYVTDLPAPPEVDALSRPGAHRAAQWERAHGGRQWGGITVSVRGYPDLRVLQVALHERWISDEEAYPALQAALRRTHFWPRIAPGEEDALIDAATLALIEQVKTGQHTPSYPIGKPYLRLLTKKDLAVADHSRGARPPLARRALDEEDAGTLEADPGSDRNLRRVASALAAAAGYPSLTLLTPSERRDYETQAMNILHARRRLRTLRQLLREELAARGVTITQRAIELFVELHRNEAPEELQESVALYLARTRRKA